MFGLIKKTRQAVAPFYHRFRAKQAAKKLLFPANKLINIGVTGTDGKSTTSSIIHHILQSAGYKTGLASTVFLSDGENTIMNETHLTTLSAAHLQNSIKKMLDNNCTDAVLEVSSHALHQNRVHTIPFDIAVFTNLSHEHLDYHRDFSDYKKQKLKLFKSLHDSLYKDVFPKKVIVVNKDCPNYQDFYDCKADEKYTFSLKDKSADLYAANIKCLPSYNTFDLFFKGQKIAPINLQLAGEYNIANALAASAACLARGVDSQALVKALETMKALPGRMESVANERGIEIIIDFAITPAAMEALFRTMRKATSGRIIPVFGCCGERDTEKRPLIGKLAGELTDIVIVTDDEPYCENPEKIRKQIIEGVFQTDKQQGKDFFVIPDRREAISKALEIAEEGDIILITGMGAFTSRTVGKAKIPWNDREVVEELLKLHTN